MVVELVSSLLLGALETVEVSGYALVVLIVDEILCEALQHLYRIGTV